MGLYHYFRDRVLKLTLAPLLTRYLSRHSFVLDVGCGGWSPIKNVVRDAYVVGLDLSIEDLHKAKAGGYVDDCVCADARKLPFVDKSLDYACAFELIEHFEKHEGRHVLSELERVAKYAVILTTPNGFLPQNLTFDRLVHRSGWTVDDFYRLGYSVKGYGGLKVFRRIPIKLFGDNVLASNPRGFFSKLLVFITYVLSDLGQLLIRHNVKLSQQLFCVKTLQFYP